MRRPVLPQLLGGNLHRLDRGYHADLHSIWENILEHTVQLAGQNRRLRLRHPIHTGGVLGSQRRYDAHPIHPVHEEGF